MKAFVGNVVMLEPDTDAGSNDYGPKKAAILISTTTDNGKALIEYADGRREAVPIDRLRMLRQPKEILTRLLEGWNIPPQDFKAMLNVYALMKKRAYGPAIESAATNNVAWQDCTLPARSWLENWKKLDKERQSKRKGI